MRARVNRSSSRKSFNKRQGKTHVKNNHLSFRGGIRL